jgi:tripartite-type tricarboxylate transporter receptor subunit TctC
MKYVKHISVLSFVAFLVLAGLLRAYAAPKDPPKVVTVIVPFAAGGPTDTIARLVARPMSVHLRKEIIVENAVGAGGIIGAGQVKNSRPDGYTLMVNHIGLATAPSVYLNPGFDPINDFEPIGIINYSPMTLVARKDFPANNLEELIAYVKANKNKVKLANAGAGSASHLAGMLFQKAIQTSITAVGYSGTGPALKGLLNGQIDFMIDQVTNTASYIKAGDIKAYGVTTKKRVASLPNVPTMEEAGLQDFDVTVWHALYAPKGTTKPIIDQLSKALQKALKDPTLNKRFADLGLEVAAQNRATPEALRAQLKSEISRWQPMIKKAKNVSEWK